MKRCVEADGRVIEYEWVPKSVKNLNLRIRSDGSVWVSAPLSLPAERADDFVRRQKDMIFRAWEKRSESLPAKDFYFGEGGILPIFGRGRTLSAMRGSHTEAVLYENRLEVRFLGEATEERWKRAIREELGRLADKAMPTVCGVAARRLMMYELPKPTLHYRCMVGKWGSCCTATAEITFNKFLVCTPPECMEYVATHELVHLLVPNHSSAFYEVMDLAMPDWRLRKKQLEPYGYLLNLL